MSETIPVNLGEYKLEAPFISVWGSNYPVPTERAFATCADKHGVFAHLDQRQGVEGPFVNDLMLLFYPEGAKQPRFPGRTRVCIQVVLSSIARALASSRAYNCPCRVKYYGSKQYYCTNAIQKATGDKSDVSGQYVVEVLGLFADLGWITLDKKVKNLKSSFTVNVAELPELDLYPVRIPGGSLVNVTKRVDYKDHKGKACHRNVVDTRSVLPSKVPEAAAWQRALQKINDVNTRFEYAFTYQGKHYMVDPLNFEFHAVFNDRAMSLGGRCYCNAQNTPSKEKKVRQTLTINGKATAEIDYSNLHIRMMYNSLGLVFEGDCYDVEIPGWEVEPGTPEWKLRRKLLKVMLLSMPNCGKEGGANRKSAVGTAVGSLAEWKKHNPGAEMPEGMKVSFVLDCILASHKPIAHLFHTGMGIRMQVVDGLIARKIMTHFTRLGKPCIGIHDSFMVLSEDADLLMHRMIVEYKSAVGFAPKPEMKTQRSFSTVHSGNLPETQIHKLQAKV